MTQKSAALRDNSETYSMVFPGYLSFGFEAKTFESISEHEFWQFCQLNPDLRIEQDEKGKLIIMAPIGHDSGLLESEIGGQLYVWRKQKGCGKTYSSATGFKLPDGSTRSPDSAWISDEKIEKLSKQERKKFAAVVPDFVIELRSETDSLKKLKTKMSKTWIKNGVRLAWLIDPQNKKTYIYRADGSVDEIEGFDKILSGENVCPDFELDLNSLKII